MIVSHTLLATIVISQLLHQIFPWWFSRFRKHAHQRSSKFINPSVQGQGFYSLRGRTSHRKSRSRKIRVKLFQSFWNLTGTRQQLIGDYYCFAHYQDAGRIRTLLGSHWFQNTTSQVYRCQAKWKLIEKFNLQLHWHPKLLVHRIICFSVDITSQKMLIYPSSWQRLWDLNPAVAVP